MTIPPEPVLKAACRWLERLPGSGTARCRALFISHDDFSDLTPTQYETAYAWLSDAGLLDDLQSHVPVPRRVFQATLTAADTTWLRDADALILSPEELPSDAAVAAKALGLSDSEAYGEIRSVWQKVDTTERARIGAAGEEAVLALLRELADAQVQHVAAWSDAHGYDIAVTVGACTGHLEVKATVRSGQAVFFLSRNEFETMLRDPAWSLIVVRLTQDLMAYELSSVPSAWLVQQTPVDRGAQGRWESCRLSVPPDVLAVGVSALAPFVRDAGSPLLTGVIAGSGSPSVIGDGRP